MEIEMISLLSIDDLNELKKLFEYMLRWRITGATSLNQG